MKRLAIAVLGWALVFGLAGCPKGAYHDAVVANHDFKLGVQAFQQAEIQEFKAGRIGLAEHQKLEAGIEKVGETGQTLTNALARNADNQTIVQDFQAGLTALGQLDPEYIGIKNPQSQAVFSALIKSLQAILANIGTLLGQTPIPATKVGG